MRSDSDRNMSASLTRITRQVSRTFDLNYGGMLHMNKKKSIRRRCKGNVDSDACCGNYCSCSLLLPCTKSRFCQQYLRSWNHSVKLCTASIVSNHYDLKCSASDYRILYMRSGIRSKNCTIQALCFHCFWGFSKRFSRIFTP